jgi:hypothetical protein
MVRSFVWQWRWIAAWVISLLAVGGLVASAQRLTISPTLVSGDDIGFRIERTVEGLPIGKLVIRVDGRWVDVAAPSTNGNAVR